jgi:hypothetical protein
LNILITTWMLAHPRGANLYVRDLAAGLARKGHAVCVYAVHAGALADRMAAAGFTIVSHPRRCPFTPDIIHGHQQPALLDALIHFPSAPAIFVIHTAYTPLNQPFLFHRIRRHVAVDQRCLNWIGEAADVPTAEKAMLFNFVDLDRFRPRAPLPDRPRKALVFSNYVREGDTRLTAIGEACRLADIELDVIGEGMGRPELEPERSLVHYDLVFAKARAAMEAMAVGCAVVLCDFAGLGGLVTNDRFDALRPWNFGAGVLTRTPDVGEIRSEIGRYDRIDAAKVTHRIRQEAGLGLAIDHWLELYGEVVGEGVRPDSHSETAVLRQSRRRWSGLRRLDAIRLKLASLREAAGVGGAVYDIGRAVWRLAGRPGAD